MKDFPTYGYFLIGSPLLFVVVLILFPGLSPQTSGSDRIALAQLIIESTGLLAIGFAIREFSKAQRKPKLELWLSKEGISKEGFVPRHTIDEQGYRPVSHEFKFHIILENYGQTIARWVKIRLFLDLPENNLILNFRMESDNREDYWNQNNSSNSLALEFDGRDSFVIYSQSRDENRGLGGYESLGFFNIGLLTSDATELGNHELILFYSIKADGMDEVKKMLILRRT